MHCLGHFTWALSPCFFSELVFIQCNCILMRGSYQMTKRLIWCCSYCRRKPPGQTIWLETWCPWSWYTDHQGQSWKTKRRERAEQPSCPLPAPPCAAPVALPWHPEVRHFDHLGFPHQAVPSSLQEKKVQGRRSVLKGCHRHLAAFSPVQQTVLKNRRIKVTSYHTKKVRTWSPNAFCTLYSLHAPVARITVSHQSDQQAFAAQKGQTDCDYP